MVRADGVTKTFTDEAGEYSVLRGVSFSIAEGETVALIGVSGAGKTTLLQILGGLDKASSGSIEVGGRDLNRLPATALSHFRSQFIGFVFQFHHLLPDFTAIENICIPGMIRGRAKKQCVPRAEELLNVMGLDRQANHYPAELSGGERQRVALARALFNDPALVLADEPTGNLDGENSRQLLALFKKANKELKQTFLVATHNERLAEGMDRMLYMEDGRVARRS
ncbi:MAG: ATP-binding cassette domain-containing protein [Chitinivibrionales bacterium]|nr:ATP-binding cassette domain-containing protein [Chitinivibrionales bacterium]MBD3356137.1 ATP-binding cassette domain-containing protein [Chitinivibrionales bacterium]